MHSLFARSHFFEFILGTLLLLVAYLIFSIWRDKLVSLKVEERADFLMYNIVGGSWIVAIFALCGGFYCLLDPLLS